MEGKQIMLLGLAAYCLMVVGAITINYGLETEQAHNWCRENGFDEWSNTFLNSSGTDFCLKQEGSLTISQPIHIQRDVGPIFALKQLSIVFHEPRNLKIGLIMEARCNE